jgi:hypothetical protein
MMTRKEMEEQGLIQLRSKLDDLIFRKKLTEAGAISFCRYCLRQLGCEENQLPALTEMEFMEQAKKFIADSGLSRKRLEKIYRDWKMTNRSSQATLKRCPASSN